MPTEEYYRGKIAHRKRKERFHREQAERTDLTSRKIADHIKKAEWNAKSIQQLEDSRELEYSESFASQREEISEMYEKIEELSKANPNDAEIPELHRLIKEKKLDMRAQLAASKTPV